MKKVNRQTVQTFLLCAILSLCCVGCSAKGIKKGKSMYASIDSVMREGIGDSLSSIILDANRVIVDRIHLVEDSIIVLKSKKLSSSDATVTKFLFVSYENYSDASKVYGKLSPNIRIKFCRKRQVCYVYMDFSMQILIFKNSDNQEMKRCVLNNKCFLKLANIIFPNDEFLTFILNSK